MKIVRGMAALAMIAFLALSPGWLVRGLTTDRERAFFEKPEVSWHGRIALWHVATFRTYQGSVTDYLQQRADAYCKKHPGVHIDVEGLTLEKYHDRVARGAFPDAYSFQTGLCYREQLAPLEIALPAFAGSVAPATAEGAVYAVPYLMSGYFLAANVQLLAERGLALPEGTPQKAFLQGALSLPGKVSQLSMPPVLAARAGLSGTTAAPEQFRKGQVMLAVLDARALGELTRGTKQNLLTEAVPYPAYTDEVFYLGAAQGASAEQRAALAGFAAFLLGKGEQARLAGLGALPVIAEETGIVYGEPQIEALYQAYRSPVAPDAFALQRHGALLEQEAALATAGDSDAAKSFFERMAVVERGIVW